MPEMWDVVPVQCMARYVLYQPLRVSSAKLSYWLFIYC